MRSYDEHQKRWAIILAGGEGKRLSSLTRRIVGDARPKQFCSMIGDTSLIEQTRGRVSLSVAQDHTLIVVTRAYKPYYEPSWRCAAAQSGDSARQPRHRRGNPVFIGPIVNIGAHRVRSIISFGPLRER